MIRSHPSAPASRLDDSLSPRGRAGIIDSSIHPSSSLCWHSLAEHGTAKVALPGGARAPRRVSMQPEQHTMDEVKWEDKFDGKVVVVTEETAARILKNK